MFLRKDIIVDATIVVSVVSVVSGSLLLFPNQFSSQSLFAPPIFIHEKVLFNTPDLIKAIRPVSGSDHIKGNINAPIKIIEYSDAECPFCKRNHRTMNNIYTAYSDSVVWVYRHHTLDHRFSRSRREAEAMECVAALGGNASFWKFLDDIYDTTPSNDRLDFAVLPNMAEDAGVSSREFTNCFEERWYAEVVTADNQEAALAGLEFTPSMVIIWPDGVRSSLIIGARHYDTIAATLNVILGKEVEINTNVPKDDSTSYSQ